jgi:hypothetical protein
MPYLTFGGLSTIREWYPILAAKRLVPVRAIPALLRAVKANPPNHAPNAPTEPVTFEPRKQRRQRAKNRRTPPIALERVPPAPKCECEERYEAKRLKLPRPPKHRHLQIVGHTMGGRIAPASRRLPCGLAAVLERRLAGIR